MASHKIVPNLLLLNQEKEAIGHHLKANFAAVSSEPYFAEANSVQLFLTGPFLPRRIPPRAAAAAAAARSSAVWRQLTIFSSSSASPSFPLSAPLTLEGVTSDLEWVKKVPICAKKHAKKCKQTCLTYQARPLWAYYTRVISRKKSNLLLFSFLPAAPSRPNGQPHRLFKATESADASADAPPPIGSIRLTSINRHRWIIDISGS